MDISDSKMALGGFFVVSNFGISILEAPSSVSPVVVVVVVLLSMLELLELLLLLLLLELLSELSDPPGLAVVVVVVVETNFFKSSKANLESPDFFLCT